MKTLRRLTLITLLLVIVLSMGATSVCFAEGEPPTEEVAPPTEEEVVPPTWLDEIGALLDAPLTTLIVSILGSLTGFLVAIVGVLKALRSLKTTIRELNGKKSELNDYKAELVEVKESILTAKSEFDKWLTENADKLEKMTEMMEIGFRSDPQCIENGKADEILKVVGVVDDEPQG